MVIEEVLNKMQISIKENGAKLDKILKGGTPRPSGTPIDEIKEEPQVVVDLVEGVDPSNVRDTLRDLAYEENFPRLTDLITTKEGKVILKTSSPEDAERVGEELKKVHSLAEKASVRVSKFKRQRLIAFGVPDTVNEEGFVELIQGVPKLAGRTVEVVRSFSGRVVGRNNWIFDVDQFTKNYFFQNPRLLVDFLRVRVAIYARVIRCFKCQRLGHVARRCRYDEACGRCAGFHSTGECKEVIRSCINCAGGGEGDHGAADKECPAYQKYKEHCIEVANCN